MKMITGVYKQVLLLQVCWQRGKEEVVQFVVLISKRPHLNFMRREMTKTGLSLNRKTNQQLQKMHKTCAVQLTS